MPLMTGAAPQDYYKGGHMLGSVYRRTSGIYVVRIVVPHRLRQAVGRTEIHASTGLREPNAAKLAALQIQLAWRKRLMELDSAKLKAGSPLLLTDGLIGLREAASLAGIPLKSLLAEMLNDRVPLYVQANGWRGWRVSDLRDIERDYDGTFILNDVECRGVQQAFTGIASPYEISAVVSALIANDAAESSLFRLTGSAAFFPDEPQPITASVCLAQKPAVELIRSRLAGLLPAVTIAPAIAPAMPVAGVSTAPIVYDPITAKHGHKPFSELFETYRNDRSWGEDNTRRMTTEAAFFSELMGDPALGEIEVETVLEYARRLATLPTDIYQARRKFKVESLHELIAVASANGLELKNESTVKRHVGAISEIFNYGVGKFMMRFNPAADFKRGRGDRIKAASARSDRDMFTPDDLACIFGADWFNTGAGKFEGRGWTDWRPHHFWLPIMGLLTGGRINELSQLYLDDIVQSEGGGVWYFDFNLAQPDKTDADAIENDKKLKTVNSIRIIPVHSVLVNLGLPEYVAALRQAGHVRLFPELTRDRVKGYGKPAGSWFNERFLGKKLGMVRNGKKVFHSFRHTFLTALERLDASESVRGQLAGHQRGKTESGTRYSKDRNAEELKPLIDRLSFPCLTGIAPFQIKAGLNAIEVSTRFKASMMRSKAKSGT